MGLLLYFLLWCCGIQVISPSLVSLSTHVSDHETNFEETNPSTKKISQNEITQGWNCPHIIDIANVSCTCDIPHTVRCRGLSSNSYLLEQLTKELISKKDPSHVISLLDLSIHEISKVPPMSFFGMPLQGLVIRGGIHTLKLESFHGLEDTLAALGLQSNNLTEIPFDSLLILQNLQRLDVSDNQIQFIKSRAFPGTLLQLNNLDLSGNGLKELNPEAFATLTNLKVLNLGRNMLDDSQINEDSFHGLKTITDLSLKANLFKGTLGSNFLTSLTSLLTLNLSFNSFTKLAFGILKSSKDLSFLDLSHNKIDIIEDHAFTYLSKLERLILSHNQIISVSGSSLAHLSKLVSLNLADNALFAVTVDLMRHLKNLRSIDLSANDISLLQQDALNYTIALDSINLSDNPLHCDCSQTWFWSWLKEHSHISKEDLDTIVCTTPPSLENAPLVELNSTDLSCSHREYYDYYHDSADYEEIYEVRISDAQVSLHSTSWVGDDVQLVWHIDQKAIPYACQAVRIYEIETFEGSVHQVLTEKIDVNCSSESQLNPHQIVVIIPGKILNPGGFYRFCLTLLEKGTDDEERFLPGCSEITSLPLPPKNISNHPNHIKVTSLTAGRMGNLLVVQTRFGDLHKITYCYYNLFVIMDKVVVAKRQLNCSIVRYTFPSLIPGHYMVCVEPYQSNGRGHNLTSLSHMLSTSSNYTRTLQMTFSACTTAFLQDEPKSLWTSAPLVTLLFTLPGLALIITIYVIGRKVWKGGGIPWKWDPRSKRAKYFLYTGETISPTVSLDPFPIPDPESTV